MFDFEFHSPWFLLLFLCFIPLLIRDLKSKKNKGIKVPTIKNMSVSGGYTSILSLLKFLKYIILFCLVIALARPRTYTIVNQQDDTKGIDIMLTIDTSLSMLSKDLNPDRLTALQGIAVDFVKQRPNDRIGLVTYSGEAITKVPVTTDHKIVIDELQNLDPMELTPGTAIGEGLSVAVSHLRHSKAKSKIIILMTDGVNTVENAMPPIIGADLAHSNDIKVYTIGIGTNGFALMPTSIDIFGDLVFTETEVQIDETTLLEVAKKTGGKYFRATSNESLAGVYNEINNMEKSDVKSSKIYNYKEYFRFFLFIAFLLLLLDGLMRWLFFKSLV